MLKATGFMVKQRIVWYLEGICCSKSPGMEHYFWDEPGDRSTEQGLGALFTREPGEAVRRSLVGFSEALGQT